MPIVAESPLIWVGLNLGVVLIRTMIVIGLAVAVKLLLSGLGLGRYRCQCIAAIASFVAYFGYATVQAITSSIDRQMVSWLHIGWSYLPLVVVALLALLERASVARQQDNVTVPDPLSGALGSSSTTDE